MCLVACVSVRICLSVSVCLFVCLSVCLSVCVTLCPSLRPSFCLFVCPFFRQYVHLCLSVSHLSVSMTVAACASLRRSLESNFYDSSLCITYFTSIGLVGYYPLERERARAGSPPVCLPTTVRASAAMNSRL